MRASSGEFTLTQVSKTLPEDWRTQRKEWRLINQQVAKTAYLNYWTDNY